MDSNPIISLEMAQAIYGTILHQLGIFTEPAVAFSFRLCIINYYVSIEIK